MFITKTQLHATEQELRLHISNHARDVKGLRVKDFTKTSYLQHKKTFTDIKNPLAFFEENPITKIFHTVSFNT